MRAVVLFVAFFVLVFARDARADEPSLQARAAFNEGAAFVQKSQWAEAIAAFERADAIAPHAVTTYNLGACERAIGHFTIAYGRFQAALAQHAASGGKALPPNLLTETHTFLDELARILVHVTTSVQPEGTTLAVDGRPLVAIDTAASPPLFAQARRAANGERPPAGRFAILLDPGAHVFVLARKGFANAVVSKTYRAGETAELDLVLDRLPATLHVGSNRPRAVVYVDGVDVGPAPADLTRVAGEHQVAVREPGFVSYTTKVSLSPGEETRLDAPLSPEKPSLFTRWWFWTAAGAVIAGAAITTYAVTRPDPQRPAVGSGSLGWSVSVP